MTGVRIDLRAAGPYAPASRSPRSRLDLNRIRLLTSAVTGADSLAAVRRAHNSMRSPQSRCTSALRPTRSRREGRRSAPCGAHRARVHQTASHRREARHCSLSRLVSCADWRYKQAAVS